MADLLADWLAGLPTCEVGPKSCDVLLATCDAPFCFKSWGCDVHIARKSLFSPQKSTSQLGKTASQVCVSQLISTENTPRKHPLETCLRQVNLSRGWRSGVSTTAKISTTA